MQASTHDRKRRYSPGFARRPRSSDASAVTLERLSTRGARLVCLGGEGVTTVEIAFDPPVRDGGELWRRMASAPAYRTSPPR